ncbi:DUF881 domain-containing protein [Nocardioides bruguierae]|uniref:DUF881 domain-containing protein n=1 Tax=Nocardioides bruguierae TaxID=2945102 RepID=A0A9X2D4U9_9ACTN|nr:DUF881 domain-containing protein [Nocardioides bruguierae]MCM0619085.1 DUF881 domain-containing protein [Nocardioides bruguierae]
MAEPLPARVTTPLLTLITQQALDEDYAHVAGRRALDQPRPSRGRPQRIAAVVIAVFGVLVATAAVQTAQQSESAQSSRAALVTRVDERRATLDRLQRRIERLTAAEQQAETTLETTRAAAVAAEGRRRTLALAGGYLAVTGPGVRIVVDDAEGGEKLIDKDLQSLVNGLWEAGAEAVSINGQRLTVLTSIMNSGTVVNVNRVPLTPPFTIEAVGDRRTLQAGLVDSQGGQRFLLLVQQYGFGFQMDNAESLDLDAAPDRTLSYASRTAQAGGPEDAEVGP